MFKENNQNKKEESHKVRNLIGKTPQVHNEGVIVECNLLDNNYCNLEIK